MRTVAMCFSLFPRCRNNSLASSCWGNFQIISGRGGNSSSFKAVGSNIRDLEGGHSRRWIRRPTTTTNTGGNTLSSKTSNIEREISEGTISTSSELNINKLEISEFERIRYCDFQQKTTENNDFVNLLTIIVFDIETTGFSRVSDRIIEIALHHLAGGENSTFQTLINPERIVPNPHIHGISTYMVNRSDVPRMKELIPILLQYVRNRQKPGGQVLWIAHNARNFDVPFLLKEFSRCSFDVPPDWLFMDTLPLARELMKSRGSKLPSKVSLQALREHYEIPLVGSAHRAMSDVCSLSLILQKMTFEMKLTVSGLVERSFRPSDLINMKKKSR